MFANAISGIAWVPLAIVWFAVGWPTTLFILLNTVFWLVFFNMLPGVRGVPRVYENGDRPKRAECGLVGRALTRDRPANRSTLRERA